MSYEAIFEDKELRKFLQNMDSRLKEVKDGKKKYLGLMSAIVFADVIDHFEKEQGPDGKWNPWSKIYKEHLDEIGRSGNRILQFDGKLRQSFKPTNVKSSSSGITWFNNAKTSKGFPYAAAHNDGGGRLPQREFMWSSQAALEKMSGQTLAFILDEGV